jgi:site-specific DNA recombinase
MAKPVKAKNTWLAGKIKCMNCGYSLSLRENKRKRKESSRYYVCSRKYVAMDCDGIGAVPAEKVEDIVFFEMREKLKEFGELQLHEKPESTLQLTKLKVRADQIEKEIDTLVEKIPTASKATMGYINKKIDELDEEHSRLKKEIADMSADIYGKKDVGVIKNYLNNWESISISDKITVVDALIESVRVNQDTVDIVWKI